MNNNFLLATDLDRTMIYSKNCLGNIDSKKICIETMERKQLSYISPKTEKFLINILRDEELKNLFVPVTTRSISQFQRLLIFNKFPYVIASNGGSILINGEVDKEWISILKAKEKNLKVSYDNIYNLLTNNLDESVLIRKIDLVDGLFYFTKISTNEEDNTIHSKLENLLQDTDWNFTIQGNKLYILPKYITKENALSYLVNNILNNPELKLITSGDGKLDIGMLKLGNIIFSPKESFAYKELIKTNKEIIGLPSGLLAPEIIIKEFLEKNSC